METYQGSPIDPESLFVGNAAISFKKLATEAQLHIYGYPIYLTGPKVLKLPTDSLINYSYENDSLWQGFEKKWMSKKRLVRESWTKKKKTTTSSSVHKVTTRRILIEF